MLNFVSFIIMEQLLPIQGRANNWTEKFLTLAVASVNQCQMSSYCTSNNLMLPLCLTSLQWQNATGLHWLTDRWSVYSPLKFDPLKCCLWALSDSQVWHKAHSLAKYSGLDCQWSARLSQFKRNRFFIFTSIVKIQSHFRESNCFNSHFCLTNGINILHLIFPIIWSSWSWSLHSWASSAGALSSNHTDSTATWYAQPRSELWLKLGAISQHKCRRK